MEKPLCAGSQPKNRRPDLQTDFRYSEGESFNIELKGTPVFVVYVFFPLSFFVCVCVFPFF